MDFKNNKLKKDLLKFTIETLSILITTKNKLKELYTTIDDESDHKKKANAISFKIRNYIKWLKTLKSLDENDFKNIESIKKVISSKSLLTKIGEINDTNNLVDIVKTKKEIKELESKITIDFTTKKTSKNASYMKTQQKNKNIKHLKGFKEVDYYNLQRVNGIGEKTAILFLEKGIRLEDFLGEWDRYFKDSNHSLVPDEILNLTIADTNMISGVRQNFIEDKFRNTKYLKHLHYSQLIGIKYFHDIQKRIPRNEIAKMEEIIKSLIYKLNKNIIVEVCGSYRRGNETSGDIDILITHKSIKEKEDFNRLKDNYLLKLIKLLQYIGFLHDHITVDGCTKYMGICKFKDFPYRRIDIRFISYNSFAPALLYFTGSADLNKKMRIEAITKGMKLNEYGLYKGIFDKKLNKDVFDEKLDTPTEESVFKLLEMDYLEPTQRNIK